MAKNSDIIPYIKDILYPDIKSVLSLGCGHHHPHFWDEGFRQVEDILFACFPDKQITGIDLFQPALDFREEFGPPGTYLLGDVANFKELTNHQQFDVILCHHVIEHLPKDVGTRLIQDMEAIAQRQIIVGAPVGFKKANKDENKYMEHLSSWTPRELTGYICVFEKDVFLSYKNVG